MKRLSAQEIRTVCEKMMLVVDELSEILVIGGKEEYWINANRLQEVIFEAEKIADQREGEL